MKFPNNLCDIKRNRETADSNLTFQHGFDYEVTVSKAITIDDFLK